LYVLLDGRGIGLQLPHPGELPHGGEVAPGSAIEDPRLLDDVGWLGPLGSGAQALVVLGAHEDFEQRGKYPQRHHALSEQDF